MQWYIVLVYSILKAGFDLRIRDLPDEAYTGTGTGELSGILRIFRN